MLDILNNVKLLASLFVPLRESVSCIVLLFAFGGAEKDYGLQRR